MMDDNKRLILACALSLLVLIGFDHYSSWRNPDSSQQSYSSQKDSASVDSPVVPSDMLDKLSLPQPSASSRTAPRTDSRAASSLTSSSALSSRATSPAPRVAIRTDQIRGSLSLRGAFLDDVVLQRYRQTTDAESPPVRLLHPRDSDHPYYFRHGWISSDSALILPDASTLWSSDRKELTVGNPVTLSWTSSQGVMFEQTIAIDDQFLFTVTSRAVNQSGTGIELQPYALISRTSTPLISDYYILHEGPLGYLNGKLEEYSYEDLREERTIPIESRGGWIGITDKYWLSAIIPPQDQQQNMRFIYSGQENMPSMGRYQTDYLGERHRLEDGGKISQTSHMFVGAKIVSVLDRYQESIGVSHLDLAVDFGWFYFLTKPIFFALDWLSLFFGNFGLGIITLTVVSRILLYPLANKSFGAMNKMRKLQPQIVAMRERLADDRTAMQQEMMALYRKHKINPAAGCLPILVQIPIFFCLYKVLFVTIEMRQAPFYGWIHDLSAMDPTNMFTLFGLLSWTTPSFLHIGLWPILMGLTMFIQQKLNPPPPDPIQARIFLFLPVIFTVILAAFPVGLVIYWTWNNILSILQQWWLMRRMDKADASMRTDVPSGSKGGKSSGGSKGGRSNGGKSSGGSKGGRPNGGKSGGGAKGTG